MTTTITRTNSSDFSVDVLNSANLVLVDFWAPWCGPCRAMETRLEALAKSYAGKLKIVKINVDDEPELSAKHNVRSIPFMVLYKEGRALESKTGAMMDGALLKWIDSHFSA